MKIIVQKLDNHHNHKSMEQNHIHLPCNLIKFYYQSVCKARYKDKVLSAVRCVRRWWSNLAPHFTLQHLESIYCIATQEFWSSISVLLLILLTLWRCSRNYRTWSLTLYCASGPWISWRTGVKLSDSIRLLPTPHHPHRAATKIQSLLFFCLLTNNIRSTSNSIRIQQYTDNTTIVGHWSQKIKPIGWK